jgi:hypothetical protein
MQKTYKAISWDSRVEYFSAYNESDAKQRAVEWAGDNGLQSFSEVP